MDEAFAVCPVEVQYSGRTHQRLGQPAPWLCRTAQSERLVGGLVES
jgi:hypothetical protein